MHVQIIVGRKDSHNQRLISPITNHRGQRKSEAHGQKLSQFNRVAFKERSEVAFDTHLNYRRELEESFRYQNTMSNGTVQERAAITLELRNAEHERQQQIDTSLRQVEQAREQKLTQRLQQTVQSEQKRSRFITL